METSMEIIVAKIMEITMVKIKVDSF